MTGWSYHNGWNDWMFLSRRILCQRYGRDYTFFAWNPTLMSWLHFCTSKESKNHIFSVPWFLLESYNDICDISRAFRVQESCLSCALFSVGIEPSCLGSTLFTWDYTPTFKMNLVRFEFKNRVLAVPCFLLESNSYGFAPCLNGIMYSHLRQILWILGPTIMSRLDLVLRWNPTHIPWLNPAKMIEVAMHVKFRIVIMIFWTERIVQQRILLQHILMNNSHLSEEIHHVIEVSVHASEYVACL